MQPHMTKIAQKFAKNRKKLLSLEGGGAGGSSKTPHGFLGGVCQKTMSVHKGEGGQKCPKFRPHGLWMPPSEEKNAWPFPLGISGHISLIIDVIRT